MEKLNCSTHLKPNILPPLPASKISPEPGKITHQNFNSDKPLRQRIGTPAPQKKSPIPDDMDLNNLSGKRGHPAIKVETMRTDDPQNKYSVQPEKLQKSCLEDFPASGNNPNCRLPKKLQPITNSNFSMIVRGGDFNGNDIRRPTNDVRISPDMSPSGKMPLPNKYTPLKPIVRKKFDFD